MADEAESLWDVDDADRFARLALRHADLLTHEEQIRWKLIRENGWLWEGRFAGPSDAWTWTVQESSLRFDELRKFWARFVEAAESGDTSKLPDWIKTKEKSVGRSSAKPSSNFDDMDDDIPF